MKKIISVIIFVSLLLTLTVPAAAASGASAGKEEIVYGLLGFDGSVESLYVVNILSAGTDTDYGEYADVKNLTNTDPVTLNGEEVMIQSSADRLYYQGTLKTWELPWELAITYSLNGKAVPADRPGGG